MLVFGPQGEVQFSLVPELAVACPTVAVHRHNTSPPIAVKPGFVQSVEINGHLLGAFLRDQTDHVESVRSRRFAARDAVAVGLSIDGLQEAHFRHPVLAPDGVLHHKVTGHHTRRVFTKEITKTLDAVLPKASLLAESSDGMVRSGFRLRRQATGNRQDAIAPIRIVAQGKVP